MNPSPTPAEDTGTPTADDIIDISKDWWQSKTIHAALIAMLPSVAHIAGIDYSLIAPYAGDIVTIIAGVAAILGRRAAVTVIR